MTGINRKSGNCPADLNSNASAERESDAEIIAAMTEYRELLDKGKCPDRQSFLARYPEFADDLASCLESLEFIQTVTPQFCSTDEASVPRAAESLPHAKLGDFRIGQEVGRGGMGVVYEAEQLSLGRRVALKVLPFASLLDKRHIERFKNEARAAAMLKHPNIVSVYQTGCDRGVHYYAMELVSGQSIAEIIKDLKKVPESAAQSNDGSKVKVAVFSSATADTSPVAKISTDTAHSSTTFCRNVAQLGIDVAHALHYAHQEGVIHRDIKPSNLLIDELGKPWISDFGLAQIQGANDLTISGDVLGTLRYMSPEQAGGQKLLDHRTDIYSLGVTLHELLTLRTPFDGVTRHALVQSVIEAQLPAPNRVDRSIPADLSTIVAKSIAKDPLDRYATAQDFAEDLQRFLEHKAIYARRPSVIRRGRNWFRRNPLLAISLSVTLLLLSVFAIGGPIVAQKQARLATRAQFNLEAAQDLLDESITNVASATKDKPGMWPLQLQLWQGIVRYYEELVQQHSRNTSVRLRLGRSNRELGRILRNMHSEDATNYYQCAIDELEAVAVLDSELGEADFELAYTHGLMSNHLNSDVADHAGAIFHAQRGVNLSRELVAKNSTLRNRRLLSGMLCFQGVLGHQGGNWEECLNEAANSAGSLYESSGDVMDETLLAFSKLKLADRYMECGRWHDANEVLSGATEELIGNRPSWRDRSTPELMATAAEVFHARAAFLRASHDLESAISVYQQALTLCEGIAQDYPEFDWGRECLIRSYLELGSTHYACGTLDKAESLLRSALMEAEGSSSEFVGHEKLRADCRYRLGCLLWWNGRRREGSAFFKESIQSMRTHKHFETSRALTRLLATIFVTCPDEMLQQRGKALELAKELTHHQDGLSYQLIGVCQFRCGRFKAAIESLRRSCDLRQDGDAYDWLHLAMANAKLGNRQKSRNWLNKALKSHEQRQPVGGFNYQHIHRFLDELRQEATVAVNSSQREGKGEGRS